MKVCLDAGHGYRNGKPTGASGNGIIEDDFNLDMVTRIGHHIRALGHETALTRAEAAFVTLASRGKLAEQTGCKRFVSMHANAAAAAAHGAEVFVAEGDVRSKPIAQAVLNVIVATGITSRGVKWDTQGQHSKIRVLRDTYRSMPAILIEFAFLTNAQDAAKLADKHWRENVAQAIAGVLVGP